MEDFIPDGDFMPPEKERRGIWLRLLTILWKSFLVIFLIVFAFLLIVSIPAVQTWTAGIAAGWLSRELNTNVKVDKVQAGIFHLEFKGLYIEDLQQDTLLYSGSFGVDVNSNLMELSQGIFKLDNLLLDNTIVRLRKNTVAPKGNWAFILDYFKSPKKQKKKSSKKNSIQIDPENVTLKNISFSNEDFLNGNHLYASLNELEAVFKAFDVNEIIHLKQLTLNRPSVLLKKEEGNCDYLDKKSLEKLLKGEIRILNDVEEDGAIKEKGLQVKIDNFKISEGDFGMKNLRKGLGRTTVSSQLDWAHLQVQDINIDIRQFSFVQDTFRANVQNISAKESSGFILEELSAKDATVSSRGVQLNGLVLRTPYSILGDTLSFRYKEYGDFEDFAYQVKILANFNQASIALRDIIVFAPKLNKNPFFSQNANEVFQINGIIKDRINDLSGRNLTLRLANRAYLKGNFDFNNLLVEDEQLLSLRVEKLTTSVNTLQQILPGLKVSGNVRKLGALSFNGNFDGFFDDFVADGSLNTDVGSATMDMRLNLKDGREKASYSGRLILRQFDLAEWTDNKDFGFVSMHANVKNGFGLNSSNANADLEAKIDSFSYKGYTYRNMLLNGEVRKSFFKGNFIAKDDLIDLVFDGSIDFTSPVPKINFEADINRLNTQRVYLTKDDLEFSGKVVLDIQDQRLKSLSGNGIFSDFLIIKEGKDSLYIDSLAVSSRVRPDSTKLIVVQSDIVDATMDGRFNLAQLGKVFNHYLHLNFPSWANRFVEKVPESLLEIQDFSIHSTIHNSKNLTQIFFPQVDTLKQVSVDGYFNSLKDSIDVIITTDIVHAGKLDLNYLFARVNAANSLGNIDLSVGSTVFGNNELGPISLTGFIHRDTLDFGIVTENLYSMLNNLALNGRFFLSGMEEYEVQFSNSNLVIYQDIWDINDNNFIRFGKNTIQTEAFVLRNGIRKIELNTPSPRGLELSVENFDLHIINDFIKMKKLDFGGPFKLTATADDIFKMEGLSLQVGADSVFINKDHYGSLRADVKGNGLKDKFLGDLILKKNQGTFITAAGFLNPPNYSSKQTGKTAITEKPDYFEFKFGAQDYPLAFMEYFLAPGIYKTEGSLNGKLELKGNFKKADMKGMVKLRNAATTIDYTDTRYFIDNDSLAITSTYMDATGITIRDKYGNTGTIIGGLTHKNINKFGVDAKVVTQKLEVLSTTKIDNPIYYGQAFAKGEVTFEGPVERVNIGIIGETIGNTKVNFPISSSSNSGDVTFIKFIDKTSRPEKEKSKSRSLDGIDVHMELRINEEADLKLIFDEKTGDVIQSFGRGNILFDYNRDGKISMYGDYFIESGRYLFTLGVVNKPFTVERGGTIKWNGDPFNAQLNLVAKYDQLEASPAPLIVEYLSSAPTSVADLARNQVPIDLKMYLSGALFKPDIRFSIDFPELSPEVASYVDSKLRLLERDQNEVNRQAFGLIVMGQFWSTDNNFQVGATLGNTVTEFISNQFSSLVTGLISDWLTEDGWVSDVDFGVSYNSQNSIEQGGLQNQLQLGGKVGFFNDRLLLKGGSGFELNNGTSNGTNRTFPYLVVEYFITEDRKLKVRLFQKYEADLGASSRSKTGLGLNYTQEFDNGKDFIDGLKKMTLYNSKKLKRSQKSGSIQ